MVQSSRLDCLDNESAGVPAPDTVFDTGFACVMEPRGPGLLRKQGVSHAAAIRERWDGVIMEDWSYPVSQGLGGQLAPALSFSALDGRAGT